MNRVLRGCCAGGMLIASVVFRTDDASACNDSTNSEDKAIQAQIPNGCSPVLYKAEWNNYQLTDDSWDGAGLKDACNIGLPFAKMIAAIFVINYSLTDNYSSQWHNTRDYYYESVAIDTSFHGDIYSRFIETNGNSGKPRARRGASRRRTARTITVRSLPAGRARTPRPTVRRSSFTRCGITGSTPRDTARRISPDPRGPARRRVPRATGSIRTACTTSISINSTTTGCRRSFYFHSPYQIQVEFDCDLRANVVRFGAAQRHAGGEELGERTALRRSSRTSRPGYRCGNPRPF